MMRTSKLVFSLAALALLTQTSFAQILQIDFTKPESATTTGTDKLPDTPELKDLVDLSSPYGLNIEKVYKRQNDMRASGHLVGTDPCVSIVNIQTLKEILKTYYTKIVPLKVQIEGAEKEKSNTLNPLKKRDLSQSIKKLQEQISAIENEQTMKRYTKPETINPEIVRLEDLVIQDLGKFGLTKEILRNLPSINTTRATSSVWPLR